MRDALELLAKEARACAIQGGLLLGRATRGPRPTRPTRSARTVVFVHGFGAGGAVFEPLRARVEEALGVETRDFSYRSNRPFSPIAKELGDMLDDLAGAGRELDLVGHSLGGLLCRWYLQELGGASNVSRLVTLATPHAGTRSARLAPGPLRSALLPGSPTVRRLASGRPRAAGVRHTAAVAGADLMVTPPASAAALHDAELRWFEDLGHNSVLYDERVHGFVVAALSSSARAHTPLKQPG